MSLTGPQLDEIQQAIVGAYSRDELRRVVRACMDLDFDRVTSEKGFDTQVYELVQWANRQERAVELVRCAWVSNQANAGLRDLWEAVQGWGRATTARPALAFDWVTIPAGDFYLGSDKLTDPQAPDDEAPQHRVDLPEYRIARTPVTVAHFAIFVAATGFKTTAEQAGRAKVFDGESWKSVLHINNAHARPCCLW